MPPPLRILFLASEADPFVKIGGLGDVAGSLPRALKTLDPALDIRLVIPFHGAIQRQDYELRTVAVFDVPIADGAIRAEALLFDLAGLPVYLIGGAPIARDAPVYTADPGVDGYKFTFFSLAALQLAQEMEWAPYVLHANDWHTAPAIYALSLGRDDYSTLQDTRTLLGLHNLPYLGIGAGGALAAFGLPPAVGSDMPAWAQYLPLPLGLLAADHIVAVSPNYAAEILTPRFGSGLHEFLAGRAGDISGILNGIDTARWDPAADPHLVLNFDLHNLTQRANNKTALINEFGLDMDPGRPLFAVVSRLDYQKGIDMLPDALHQVSSEDWSLIVLGTGDPTLEAAVLQLEIDYPARARSAIRFDSALSHRIYAGADALLIPSRYEPCGLTQMIAMRYGCLPIARATGGLADTITDHDQSGTNTGFLFEDAASEDLAAALRRALIAYQDQDQWRVMQRNAMLRDFSWQRSAEQYLALYHKLIKQVPPESQVPRT